MLYLQEKMVIGQGHTLQKSLKKESHLTHSITFLKKAARVLFSKQKKILSLRNETFEGFSNTMQGHHQL